MKLLHEYEHIACLNYCSERNPQIEFIHVQKDQRVEHQISYVGIVFLTEGEICITYESLENLTIYERQFFIIPAGGDLVVHALKDANMVMCRIENPTQLCDMYNLETLQNEIGTDHPFAPLDFNDRIDAYLNSLIPCVKDGLRCKYFFEAKYEELLFLLRGYYTKEQLGGFFALMAGNANCFVNFVWKNYRKVKDVNEFSRLANLSTSAFRKKFKGVFKMPASQWLSEQKARNLYRELMRTDKCLKELSAEYHFCSPSHLITFCKEKLHMTPSEIRNKKLGQAKITKEVF